MWSTVWLSKLLGGGLLWMMILLEKDSQCQAPVMVQNSDFAETNDKWPYFEFQTLSAKGVG